MLRAYLTADLLLTCMKLRSQHYTCVPVIPRGRPPPDVVGSPPGLRAQSASFATSPLDITNHFFFSTPDMHAARSIRAIGALEPKHEHLGGQVTRQPCTGLEPTSSLASQLLIHISRFVSWRCWDHTCLWIGYVSSLYISILRRRQINCILFIPRRVATKLKMSI